MWLHVDGAYGAPAALFPVRRPIWRPCEGGLGGDRSAQVAVRPARGRLRAGARPEDLRNAFSYHPPYYQFSEEAPNFFEYGPQNSRGFRALKVWLSLQQVGRMGYEELIAEDMRLSRQDVRTRQAHPELEALTQSLSIATFRYVPPELRAKWGTRRSRIR